MTRPASCMLGYVQRAVRREFAAALQVTLLPVVARASGEPRQPSRSAGGRAGGCEKRRQ
jgi:hypothetical protein